MKLLVDRFLKLITDKLIFFTIGWLVILLGYYFYFIDKSFYFADEAFYLLNLIPDIYKIEVSQWAKLYRFFYFDHIIVDKLFLVFIQLLSVTFFAMTAIQLFFNSKKHYWCIVIATIASMFLLVGPNRMTVANYITLNFEVTLLGTSFLFLFFKKKYIWSLFLSGFFIGALPFIMITTLPTFFFFLVVIWLYTKKVKNLFLFSIGIFSFFLFFFLIIQSPTNFLIKFKEAYLFMQDDSSHGIIDIIIWSLKVFYSKTTLGFLFILYYYVNKKYNFTSWLNILMSTLFVVWFSSIAFSFVFRNAFVFDTGLYYFLAIALLIEQARATTFKKNVLIIFLLLLPFFVMIGTNVAFFMRSTMYFSFIFIALIYLVKTSRNKMVVMFFGLILTISTIAYVSSPFFITWGDFKGIEQNQKFISSKGTICLDKKRLKILEEVKPFIENKKNVIISDPRIHGVLYLNNATPPFFYYSPDKSTEKFLIKKEYDYTTYIFLEYKKYPFRKEFLENVTNHSMRNFNKIETQNFIIYTYGKSDE